MVITAPNPSGPTTVPSTCPSSVERPTRDSRRPSSTSPTASPAMTVSGSLPPTLAPPVCRSPSPARPSRAPPPDHQLRPPRDRPLWWRHPDRQMHVQQRLHWWRLRFQYVSLYAPHPRRSLRRSLRFWLLLHRQQYCSSCCHLHNVYGFSSSSQVVVTCGTRSVSSEWTLMLMSVLRLSSTSWPSTPSKIAL